MDIEQGPTPLFANENVTLAIGSKAENRLTKGELQTGFCSLVSELCSMGGVHTFFV
jgi:hypothetical protein